MAYCPYRPNSCSVWTGSKYRWQWYRLGPMFHGQEGTGALFFLNERFNYQPDSLPQDPCLDFTREVEVCDSPVIGTIQSVLECAAVVPACCGWYGQVMSFFASSSFFLLVLFTVTMSNHDRVSCEYTAVGSS